MGFIKVRSKTGPATVYEISEEAYNARPDAFVKVSATAEKKKATPVAKRATVVARKGEKK